MDQKEVVGKNLKKTSCAELAKWSGITKWECWHITSEVGPRHTTGHYQKNLKVDSTSHH